MEYLSRTIDQHLLDWKNSRNLKPLLLRGARQVGKSTAVKHLGESFDYFINANFEKQPELKSLFTAGIGVREIANRIGALYSTPVEAGKTLLFLDEIQACPEAIHALWAFREDYPTLHVIAAGSLLEFALKQMPSFGVGRIRSLFMYPMSFDEWLQANGKREWLRIKQEASPSHPLFEAMHLQLQQSFRSYLIVGGMPAAVVIWVETGDYRECAIELNDVVQTYYDDFSKYAEKVDTMLLRNTLQSVVMQIGKKFTYSHVEGGYRTEDVKRALRLLCDSGLITIVQHTAANGLPLGAEVNEKYRKYIYMDSGLLLRILDLDFSGANELTQQILIGTATDLVNKGNLTEMVAGLELTKYSNPQARPELFYWENTNNGASSEIDYVLSRQMQIVPLEVKAGTSGKMKSLRLFMEKKHIQRAVRCSLENFGQLDDGIDIIPLYAISQI